MSTARALEVTETIMQDLTEASELKTQAAIEKLHAATNSKAEAIATRPAGHRRHRRATHHSGM